MRPMTLLISALVTRPLPDARGVGREAILSLPDLGSISFTSTEARIGAGATASTGCEESPSLSASNSRALFTIWSFRSRSAFRSIKLFTDAGSHRTCIRANKKDARRMRRSCHQFWGHATTNPGMMMREKDSGLDTTTKGRRCGPKQSNRLQRLPGWRDVCGGGAGAWGGGQRGSVKAAPRFKPRAAEGVEAMNRLHDLAAVSAR